MLCRVGFHLLELLCRERTILIAGKRADLLDTTNPDWAPTVNLGHDNIKNISLAVGRNARSQRRNDNKRKFSEMVAAETNEDSEGMRDEEVVEESGAAETTGGCTFLG